MWCLWGVGTQMLERLGRVRAHRALGPGREGTQCLPLRVWPSLMPWNGETRRSSAEESGHWGLPAAALTFLVTVLFLFLLLQTGVLLLLLLEQPLLQLPLLVGLEQQVGERAGGRARGARLGWLVVGWGAGTELLLS